MSVALAQPGHAVADAETLRFHRDSYVFDGLSIAYVLEKRFAARCLGAASTAPMSPSRSKRDGTRHCVASRRCSRASSRVRS